MLEQAGEGFVGAAVVDHHDFVAEPQAFHHLAEPFEEAVEDRCLVEHRHDYGEFDWRL